MQQRNEDFIVITATKITLCALIKKLFNTKNITQIKIGKRQHYSKLNRVKAKLYVSIMYQLRGLRSYTFRQVQTDVREEEINKSKNSKSYFLMQFISTMMLMMKVSEFKITKCIYGTSLRVVVGQRFLIPVVGQSVFVENGRDDDRINNYAFM